MLKFCKLLIKRKIGADFMIKTFKRREVGDYNYKCEQKIYYVFLKICKN